MIKNILILFFVISLNFEAFSQDLHFSQFYNSPIFYNPAQTGFSQYNRLALEYRNQWFNYANFRPYSTTLIYTDFKFPFDKRHHSWVIDQDWYGIGAVVKHDIAGDGSLTTTGASINFAYHLAELFDNTFTISLGTNIAVESKKVDYGKFNFENQWNGFEFTDLPNHENYNSSLFNEFYADIGAGAMFTFQPNKNHLRIDLGASMQHLNSPKYGFYDYGGTRLGQKLVIHTLLQSYMTEYIDIQVGGLYTTQSNAKEIVAGSNLLFGPYTTGIWYRLNSDLIFVLGKKFENYDLTFDYELNISRLNLGTPIPSTLELSFIYRFKYCATEFNKYKITSCRGNSDRKQPRPTSIIAGMCKNYVKNHRFKLKDAVYYFLGDIAINTGISGTSSNSTVVSEYSMIPGGSLFIGGKANRFTLGASFGSQAWQKDLLLPFSLAVKFDTYDRAEEFRNPVQLYFSADAGYSFSMKKSEVTEKEIIGGFFIGPGLGLKIPISNNHFSKFNLSLQYLIQNLDEKYYFDSNSVSNKTENKTYHFFCIKAGFIFGDN